MCHITALAVAVAALCLSTGAVPAERASSGADCSAELEQAAEVQTGGCAGFEAFSVDDGPPMLAVANLWDGRSLSGARTACALALRRS